jgi:hypothetical protein
MSRSLVSFMINTPLGATISQETLVVEYHQLVCRQLKSMGTMSRSPVGELKEYELILWSVTQEASWATIRKPAGSWFAQGS